MAFKVLWHEGQMKGGLRNNNYTASLPRTFSLYCLSSITICRRDRHPPSSLTRRIASVGDKRICRGILVRFWGMESFKPIWVGDVRSRIFFLARWELGNGLPVNGDFQKW